MLYYIILLYKMKVGIYAPVKNELRIIEFINYYLKIGINYFIFFDDNSEIPLNEILLQNNISTDIFTIFDNSLINIHIPNDIIKWKYCNKYIWLNIIYPILLEQNIDYLLNIDADEFLYISNKFNNNIQQMINNYYPVDSLKINWVLFGSNNLKINNTNSLINTFTKSNDCLSNIYKQLTKVSSIDLINGQFYGPHCLSTVQNSITKNILNELTEVTSFIEDTVNMYKYSDVDIYIAHYSCQDITTYVRRKLNNIIFLQTHCQHILINYTDENINSINENIINNNDELIDYLWEKVNNISSNKSYTKLLLCIENFILDFFISFYMNLNNNTKNNFDLVNIIEK